jgi:uroporphyrinogen-III synthase
MRVLITRPYEDSQALGELLVAAGHQPLCTPLLETRWFDGATLNLDGVVAILATSANAIRALVRRTSRRDIAVFAVGPQTAQEARNAGFIGVQNADGDAHSLIHAVPGWVRPDEGVLLQVCSVQSTGSVAESLTQNGYHVRREILYTVDALALSAAAASALRQGAIDAALFFSPRSARIFVEATASLPLGEVIAICISPATAAALPPKLFSEIRIATRPNQESLLALLN